jgi:hypothetical protein
MLIKTKLLSGVHSRPIGGFTPQVVENMSTSADGSEPSFAAALSVDRLEVQMQSRNVQRESRLLFLRQRRTSRGCQVMNSETLVNSFECSV